MVEGGGGQGDEEGMARLAGLMRAWTGVSPCR